MKFTEKNLKFKKIRGKSSWYNNLFVSCAFAFAFIFQIFTPGPVPFLGTGMFSGSWNRPSYSKVAKTGQGDGGAVSYTHLTLPTICSV